jgi:acetyltransferase EpsM
VSRCSIVGAGAQGRVVLETWRAARPDGDFVFLDANATLHGTTVLGAPVTGAPEAADLAGELIVALGDNHRRLAVAAGLAARGARFGVAIHPSAVVAPSATIGEGTVLLPGAIVHTDARVGAHVIVNTGAIVEHDCIVEEGAALSPGVRMGGRARVGARAFLSTGVTLGARTSVGADAVVGAGSVVVDPVPDATLAFGVPARVQRAIDSDFDVRRLL